MKIVHFNTFPEGGSWEYAKCLSETLVTQGHQSQIFTRREALGSWSDRLWRKVTLRFAKGPWHGTRRASLPIDELDLQEVDLVHLHTVADWFDVPRWLCSLPKHIKVVISLHDLWHLSGGCFVYNGCEDFSRGCRSCPLLKFPAKIIFARDEFRRKAKAYRGRPVHFIANSGWLERIARLSKITDGCDVSILPPPVDFSVFRPLDRALCRRTFGFRQEHLVVATGCASLTDKNKDTPSLLKILASVKAAHLKVIVFGEGKIGAPEGLDVTFTGPINSREKAAQLYNAADLFVSASKMESYGLTFVEALSCGTPVVGYRIGGIPEAVLEGPFSRLCPPGDVSAMREAVEEMLSSLPRVPKTAIRELVERNSALSVAEKLGKIYQAL